MDRILKYVKKENDNKLNSNAVKEPGQQFTLMQNRATSFVGDK